MDYIFDGYHLQDKSVGRKTKYYITGMKSQKEIDVFEKKIIAAIAFVTAEDQMNYNRCSKIGIAPLLRNTDGEIGGCALYISKALILKLKTAKVLRSA